MQKEAAKAMRPIFGGLAGVMVGTGSLVACGDKDPPHHPELPFYFKPIFNSFDVPSCRRGYEVYRQVCSTCHSMKQIHFRHLVNSILPQARVKQIAGTYDVTDGPNEEGEMYQRPGILTDAFPNPYPNEEAARYSNGGALPPDLSMWASAKHDGPEYIFSLLTGYKDPPLGVELRSGLYYNTYMAGGAIAMPPPLEDGQVEYECGTPATVSQMAHDVAHFITWASDPTQDERKLLGAKLVSGTTFWMGAAFIFYKWQWTTWKTIRYDFKKAVLHH